MITNNVIQRTYFISVNNDTGSSFTMEHEDKQYLITAKHVLESLECNNGDSIQIKIFRDEEWFVLYCNVYFHDDPEIDIAVLQTEQVQFPRFPVIFGPNNLILGGDIFFLGFPYGMFTADDGSINQKFPIPFVKKGVLSAMTFKYNITTLYLDAHNNSGFSGGPIVTISSNREMNVVGVNVSYIKHDNVVNVEEQDEDGYLYQKQLEYFENSGIMEAQSIHHVTQIISQNNL